MTVDLVLVVGTSHQDLMAQASQHLANGYVPLGSPYVPPAEWAVPMEGEEAGRAQMAWVFFRQRQELVAPVIAGVPGASFRRPV